MAGALNTLSTYLIYIVVLLAAPYAVAYTVSFVAGIGLSFLLNSYYVFRTAPSRRSAAQYPLVYAVQYLAGLLGLHVLVRYIGLGAQIAPLVTLILTVPLSFVLSRHVIRGKAETD